MTKREALADKILLLGLDGMDPRLTRKYVDMGLMPNVAQYIKRGAARHDLEASALFLIGQITVI